MSFFRLPSILLLAGALVSPLEAVEVFRPEPVTWSEAQEGPFSLGDSWVAFREGQTLVKVVDRATGQVLNTFATPAPDTPVEGVPNQWRTLSGWGQILHHGNKLATVSSAQIRNSPPGFSGTTRYVTTVFLWDLPSGTPAGVLDIELSTWNAFAALSPKRLVVLDEAQRRFLQWDPVTLAPLPSITVPPEFPAPANSDLSGGRPVMAGEDTVVFRKQGHDETPDLVSVNLSTGAVSRLPLPADRVLLGRTGIGGRDNGLLVATLSSGSTNAPGKLDLIHYDLTTGTIVGESSLNHTSGSANGVNVLVQPDGGWRVLGQSSNFQGLLLVSGHDLKVPSTARIDLPYLPEFYSGGYSNSTGVLGATASGLWFKPRSVDLPGVRALRLPAGTSASTIVDVTALPCAESDGVLKIKLTCSPASATPWSVRLRTKDGSATAAGDYTAVDRVETMAAGETELIVNIPITADTELESTEFFEVELSDPSPSAILPVTRVVATIRATSVDLLPPAPVHQAVPAAAPHRVFLANGTLLQFNQRTENSSAPKLVRKPFEGGEWVPSADWGRLVVSGQSAHFFGRSGTMALLREDDQWAQYPEYTLYDVADDRVLFRVKATGFYPSMAAAIGPSRFFFDPGSSASPFEYNLSAPNQSRPLGRSSNSGNARGVAYTRDFLAIINYSSIDRYSLADGSDLGPLLPSGPWKQPKALAAEDDLLAIHSNEGLWVLDIDQPEQVKRVDLPAGGSNTYLEFADGILYLAVSNGPTVCVIDPRHGVVLDILSDDFRAAVPEGWSRDSAPGDFYMQSFSAEGGKAALLAYEGDFYNNFQSIVRLSREGKLPSLRNPAPIREGDGELSLQLAEAAPFPITVTTRTVTTVHNQQEDWSGAGSAVIPAGQATFATGLSVVDDRLSEGDREVALEVTLSGNGHSETRRLPLRLLDNDRIYLADIPHRQVTYDRVFAAVGGEWAVRSGIDSFAWTGDPDFLATTPHGWEADYEFPVNMAGSGGWLAVTHDTWGGNFDTKYPSSVFVYQPAGGSNPVRVLKGMKRDNYFGSSGLFIRGGKLWVGAHGRYETNGRKKIDVKGQAFEYDLASGKRTRTFKPQKANARTFGYRITANDASVWFSSYDSPTGTGAVSQYSRATGKWLRTLPDPAPGSAAAFGSQLEANADTLIATASGEVRGYSAATGALAWTIPFPGASSPPIELVRDDLLAVGIGSLFFYHLVPGQQPVMLVNVTSGPNGLTSPGSRSSKLEVNGNQLMVYGDNGSTQTWTIMDLRGIPQLAAFFPPPAAPALEDPAVAGIARTAASRADGLGLEKSSGGWTLSFDSRVPLTGLPGTEVTLESSIDLKSWETVARHDSGGWVPLVDWLARGDGNAVNIRREETTRYFRLRLSPLAE
jgi:hypothetical protein